MSNTFFQGGRKIFQGGASPPPAPPWLRSWKRVCSLCRQFSTWFASFFVEFIFSFEESTSLICIADGRCFVMLYICLAWEAKLRMEVRSFMVRNFTTMDGAVTEVDEEIADVFRGSRWTFENMIRSRFEAQKYNFSEINVRIIFSEVAEVSFFFIGIPWNNKLNSFERSSCMIAVLRFSVACIWSSVSRLTSLLSRFSIFSWATSKLVSIRLGSFCARRRSADWSNWSTSFSVGSPCAFCAIGFLECLKVTFSMTLQATALTTSS